MKRAVALVMAVAACSSSTSGGTASPPGDAATDSTTDAAGTGCLAIAPGDGAMCGPQGLVCENGTATVQACDTVASCNGGRWQVTAPNPGGQLCHSGTAAQCPASLAMVPLGQHCSPLALVCDYPGGRCACDVRTGTATDASAQATWICPSPRPGCPVQRPRLGTSCSNEGLGCDYGTCAIPGATAETCTGGAWVEAAFKCGG